MFVIFNDMYELSITIFALLLLETHTTSRETVDTLSNNTESQLHAKRVNSAYGHVVLLVQALKT